MTPSIRTSIAYIAGCLIQKKTFSALHDGSLGNVIVLSGSFNNGNIDVHDRKNGVSVIGLSVGNDASFLHSPENASITLQHNGVEFKGSDTTTNRSFNGSVIGMTVKLYDYDEGKYFYYGLVE
jgi:hypothetical protein